MLNSRLSALNFTIALTSSTIQAIDGIVNDTMCEVANSKYIL